MLLVHEFPKNIEGNVPNNFGRNPPLCYFPSFSVASLTSFISNPYSSRDLTIFLISYIFSHETIKAVVPDLKIFIWIATSVGDTAAIKPKGIKKILANSVSNLLINGKSAVINGLRKLRNPPSCLKFFYFTNHYHNIFYLFIF